MLRNYLGERSEIVQLQRWGHLGCGVLLQGLLCWLEVLDCLGDGALPLQARDYKRRAPSLITSNKTKKDYSYISLCCSWYQQHNEL